MKCIAGVYPPTSGRIVLAGGPVHFLSPLDARRHGIEAVFQDLALASGAAGLHEHVSRPRACNGTAAPARPRGHGCDNPAAARRARRSGRQHAHGDPRPLGRAAAGRRDRAGGALGGPARADGRADRRARDRRDAAGRGSHTADAPPGHGDSHRSATLSTRSSGSPTASVCSAAERRLASGARRRPPARRSSR